MKVREIWIYIHPGFFVVEYIFLSPEHHVMNYLSYENKARLNLSPNNSESAHVYVAEFAKTINELERASNRITWFLCFLSPWMLTTYIIGVSIEIRWWNYILESCNPTRVSTNLYGALQSMGSLSGNYSNVYVRQNKLRLWKMHGVLERVEHDQQAFWEFCISNTCPLHVPLIDRYNIRENIHLMLFDSAWTVA